MLNSSPIHQDIEDNEKMTLGTVRFHNETKCSTDIIEHMTRNIRCMHQKDSLCKTLHNMLDLARINVWIIYKYVIVETNACREAFIKLLSNCLRQNYVFAKIKT